MSNYEFSLLPGVSQAILRLNKMGFPVIVISNQPGVAKGKFTEEIFEAINAKMHRELAGGGARLDAVYCCLHHPEAKVTQYKIACDCRKPKPGLLFQAAKEKDIYLKESYFIGDGITDVLAGQAAGTRTILIASRKLYLYDALLKHGANPNHIVSNLAEAVEIIEGRLP